MCRLFRWQSQRWVLGAKRFQVTSDRDFFESGKKTKLAEADGEEKITNWQAFDRPWEQDGEFTIRYFINRFINKQLDDWKCRNNCKEEIQGPQ